MGSRYVATAISVPRREQTFWDSCQEFLSKFGTIVSSHTLSTGHVVDYNLELSADYKQLRTASREFEDGFDIVIQLDNSERKDKRLVVFDMDSTLIQQEVIDMIAAYGNIEPQVAAITESAMRGEIDFSESLRQRVALLKGIPSSVFEELKTKITFTPGGHELCRELKKRGVKLAVLSGGFIPLAKYVKGELGLDYAYANNLEESDGKLTGVTTGRIVNNTMKAQLLQEIAASEGIPLANTIAIGDGSNDLDMMAVAGFGIGFNAKPLVQEKAPGKINTGSLKHVLYVLGYSDEELAN